MYLKSIVLKGFKSFPDRTRLEFGPGVSVIVGPNGSGKSNVTDAVLWALGEQSPLAVRGQSMQDVIFAGAPGRQASRTAEVELILDDCDGVLGLGVPEVSILRRLDRTGEGEYRLAGARCRLVDVIEVLSDTGLGKEMHSVISQGRVESIVTSKPRDRRLLIEEAAGLGKHRKRRRRAQLKLARTQDNLDRALDVEREARSRLRPLKRQAEAAELHERLERQALETRWELARDDLRRQREVLEDAQARATEARGGREQLERELEAVARRREAAEETLARRSAQREELSRRCFAAQSAYERVSYRVESLRAAASTVEDRLRRSRERLDSFGAEDEPELSDPDADSRIAALEAALGELERDREERLAVQLAELETELSAAQAAIEDRTRALDEVISRRSRAEKDSEQAASRLRQAERGVEEARRQAAGVGAELAAVNHFLRTQGRPGNAAILADQLEVDPGYELAVAAVLEGRLRAAVVGDRAAAEALLDHAGADGARALVTGGSAGDIPGDETGPSAAAERLLRHVRGPERVIELVQALLAGVWVVDSLDGLPDRFTGIAVTRSGRVWSAPTREIRQAPAVGEERVLAERNRREQLIAASESAAQAELSAAAALDSATAAYQQCEAEREAVIAAHRVAVRERDDAAEHERRIAAVIERRRTAPDEGPGEDRRRRLVAELAAERDKAERAAAQRAERAAYVGRLRHAVGHDEHLLPTIRATIESLSRVSEAISFQRQAFDAALAADRQAGEHVAAELRTCAREEAEFQARLHASTEIVTETEVAFLRARDRAAEFEAELTRLAGRLELDGAPAAEELPAEQRAGLEGRLERLARRREQLGPVNPLAQQEYAEAVEHVEELERQRADLETALRELEKLIADTDRQIRDTFEQTFTAAARNFEQVAAQLFPGGKGRLRLVSDADGQARVLGGATGVNGAGPGDDGATATDGEEPAAELETTPEEDLLGVEIEINPAGKEMKRLTLLSGGEKSMTALAFLFAVFLARPCPFYILDEVEAALDDLNIDRFLALLRSYSQQAQFIVVTHQRRTMEAADILYGVSMGSDGVSKIISQRLPREAEAAA